MSGIDLSKFKKIAEDKQSYTLKSADGHSIKVAKAPLSPKMRAQFAKLPVHKADGGDEETGSEQKAPVININTGPQQGQAPPYLQPNNSPNANVPGTQAWTNDMTNVDNMAARAAEDAKPENVYKARVKEELARRQEAQMIPFAEYLGFEPTEEAAGQHVLKQMANEKIEGQEAKQKAANDFMKTNELRQQAGLSPLPPPPGMGDPGQLGPQNVDLGSAAQGNNLRQQAGLPAIDPYSKFSPTSGLDMQMRGINQEAKAQGQMATEQQKAYQNHMQSLQEIQTNAQKLLAEHTAEVDNVIKDMKSGAIDPDRFANRYKKEHSPLRTWVGIILGGMSTQANHINPFLQRMQEGIKTDIDAQKFDIEKGIQNRQNLLGALEKRYGNQMDAQKMYSAISMSKMEDEIKMAAAKFGTPIAQARAMQLIGPIQQQKNEILRQVSLRQAAQQQMTSGTMAPSDQVRLKAMMGEIPKEKEDEVLKAIDQQQNLHQMEGKLFEAFDSANKTNTLGNRALHAGSEPAEVGTLKSMFVVALKNALGRAPNETEIHTMEEAFIPAPGDADAKIRAKRVGLQNWLDTHKAPAILDRYRIHMAPAARFNKR